MSEEQAVYHARTEPDINLVPKTKVDVALIYARYCESKGKDDGGYPELFTRKFPAKSPAAKVLEMQDWETLPDKCMQVLAEEVRKQRLEIENIMKRVLVASAYLSTKPQYTREELDRLINHDWREPAGGRTS